MLTNSSYLITYGDIFRNISLITLFFYLYNNNQIFIQSFFMLYFLSCIMIGYYAFTHDLKSRAYSEWFGGIIILFSPR